MAVMKLEYIQLPWMSIGYFCCSKARLAAVGVHAERILRDIALRDPSRHLVRSEESSWGPCQFTGAVKS